MTIKQIKTDFTSGILSFGINGRTDLEIYSKGLADAYDCKIGVMGGVSNTKIAKKEIGTWTKEGNPTNQVNRMVIKTGANTFVMKEGTLEKDGKVYKAIETTNLAVNSIDSTGNKNKESDYTPREAQRKDLGEDRKFRYDPRDMSFYVEQRSESSPPQIVVVYEGIGKFVRKKDIGAIHYYEYDIVTTPAFDTVKINNEGNRIVEDHTITADKIKVLDQYFDTFNSLVLYKNRLVCTNANKRNNVVLISCSDDIFNFENNQNMSGEAIKYTFPEAQNIYSAFEFKSLLLFTSQGVWALDRNQALTPLNIPFDEVLAVPPAPNIAPAKVGSKLFYVNKSLTKVYMLEYVTSNEMTGFRTLDTTTPIEDTLSEIEFIAPVQTGRNDGYSILYVQTKTQSYLFTIVVEEGVQNWVKLSESFDFEHYQFFGDNVYYFGKDGKVYILEEVPTDTTKITLLKPFGSVATSKGEELIAFNKEYQITGMKIMVRGKYDLEVGFELGKVIGREQYKEPEVKAPVKRATTMWDDEIGTPVNVKKNIFAKGFTDVSIVEIKDSFTAYFDDDVYIKIKTKNKCTILGVEYDIRI